MEVGQRVIVNGEFAGRTFQEATGMVCNKDTMGYGVHFDKVMNGHDCDGNCPHGYGWFFPSTGCGFTIKPLKPRKSTRKDASITSIAIYFNGKTTVAVAKGGHAVLKKAECTCSPDDHYSQEIGAQLALSRLLFEKTKQ